MVGHEQGRNGVGTLGKVAIYKSIHRRHIILCISAQSRGKGAEIIELEAGCQALVVALFRIVSIPLFRDHEDVILMSGGPVRRVAMVEPLLQQRLVGRVVEGADASADMLDRIQPETIDTQVDPLVRRSGHVLEAGVVFRMVGIAVVQVRHPVAEATHVVEGFRGDVRKFDLITTVSGKEHISTLSHQIYGRSQLQRLDATVGAKLGASTPVGILAYQHSPLAVDIHHQIVGAVALIHKLDRLVAYAILPHIHVPGSFSVRQFFSGLGNRQLGRTGGRLLPFTRLIGRSLQHRERGVILGGIRTEEIVVPIRAGRIGQRFLEPGVALSGVVQHVVHIDLDSPGMGSVDQILEVLFGTVNGVHGIIVRHVIGVVTVRRMRRRQPQSLDSQALQIIQFVPDAIEVPDSVPVAVREGIDQQLVGRGKGLRIRQNPPGLNDRDRHGTRTLDRDRTGAVLARVGIGLHLEGGLAGSGGLPHLDPGCGRGRRPVLFGGDIHEFGRCVLGLEGDGFGADRQLICHFRVVSRRIAGDREEESRHKGEYGE